jgi:hypothetical protein
VFLNECRLYVSTSNFDDNQRCAGHEILMAHGARPVGFASPPRPVDGFPKYIPLPPRPVHSANRPTRPRAVRIAVPPRPPRRIYEGPRLPM